MHGLHITSAQKFTDFRTLTTFVHINNTSKMAVCYYNDVDDVTTQQLEYSVFIAEHKKCNMHICSPNQ